MADNAQVINLLPDEKLKLLQVQRVNAIVTAASAVVIIVCVAIIIVLLGAISATQFSLTQKQNQIKHLNSSISSVDKLDDGTSLQARATVIQTQLGLIKSALDAKEKRQFVASLQKLIQIIPPTVSLSQATVSATGVVTVSGNAQTYNDIGRFAQALKVDGDTLNPPSSGTTNYFNGVTITAAAFAPSTNIYSYNITYALGSEANSVSQ